MSAARLLTDLARLGIHLEVQGDDLRYRPQSAVTLDLVNRMKTHKSALLAMLRPDAASPGAEPPDAVAAWQAAIDLLEGDPDIPPDVMDGLRAADVRWADDEPEGDGADDDLEVIDVPAPCAACGGIEFWWNALGDERCMNCTPPEAATRLLKRAENIRRRSARRSDGKAAAVDSSSTGSRLASAKEDNDQTDKQTDTMR